jgi:hypothetical protein
MADEEIPDWLKPGIDADIATVDDAVAADIPDFLKPTELEPSLPPPPTPLEIEEEDDNSFWSRYTSWAKPMARPLLRSGLRAADDL